MSEHNVDLTERCWQHIVDTAPKDGDDKWDLRFAQMARLVSSWSKDPSTQVGAVVVRPDRTVMSLGFNGFPQGMNDDPALYADRPEKLSRIVHAEINALLFARGSLRGCTLYTWPCPPCDRCCTQLIQAGVTRFVFPAPDEAMAARWGNFERTKSYIREVGATFTEISR